jgi:hypothetical protein
MFQAPHTEGLFCANLSISIYRIRNENTNHYTKREIDEMEKYSEYNDEFHVLKNIESEPFV